MNADHRRLGRAAWLSAIAGATFLASCNIPGRRAYNLDELHEANGRHKHRAALVGDVEFVMREGFGGILRGMGKSLEAKEPSKVEDPTEACLENLLGLLGGNSRDPDVAAIQVELCLRLVANDPWQLSRERAAVGLGRAGERMRLADRPERTPGAKVVTADELGDLLARFVQAVTRQIAQGDAAGARPQFEALCAEARANEYDAQGLPRILRGVRLLDARLGRDVPAIRELSLELQARAIEQGLALALADEAPVVAAAATWAGRRAFGDRWCERVIARVRETVPPAELLIAYARECARRGLPSGEAGETSIEIFLSLSGGHADGRVRMAAMQALTTASGGEVVSLREEDWLAWQRERDARSASGSAAPKKPADPGPP
ncbi:MAG: hypothetical protein L6Q99_07445 [Planctomycetes bacterium]|nr:hypothetical protein [Planctomycetota bacterium]